MTPSELRALDRDQVIFIITHELLHRLMRIEPAAISIDNPTGNLSVFTVTEEGKFLADTLRMLDNMRRN